MAGILKRFGDIMSANINALLDKAEDPAKMIDQYLRDLESDLGKVKAETAAIMAEEKRAKRDLDECIEETEKMQKYAEKAVLAGNDSDAKTFLMKKSQLLQKHEELKKVYELAASNAANMRTMHDKIVNDISELNSRKAAIKSKIAVAKTQERINKIGSSMDGVGKSMSAFDRMEAKADKMLDEANAMAELNSQTDDAEALMSKYDDAPNSDADDELAALKAKMGL